MSVMDKKKKLEKEPTIKPVQVIRFDEFFTEPLICLYSFIAERRTGLISKNASNCNNPAGIDLKLYIQKHLLKHSGNRYVLKYVSIVNRVLPVCISIRIINTDNKLITFAFYNEKHPQNHTDIEALKNSIMIHENNIIIDGMKNCIQELHERISLMGVKIEKSEKVAFPVKRGIVLKNVTEIKYCIADGNYSKIHYIDNSVQCLTWSLKCIEKNLENYSFFSKIHRSYIINDNYVKEVKGRKVIMKSGEVFDISIRKNKDYQKKCRLNKR